MNPEFVLEVKWSMEERAIQPILLVIRTLYLSHLIIIAVQVLLELAPKVGDGDKAFFQKMNIFIEWIIRFFWMNRFFEWIFLLYYWMKFWMNQKSAKFIRKMNKKCILRKKRPILRKKWPNLHVFLCFLKLRLFLLFE